jgi:hypothetical protein
MVNEDSLCWPLLAWLGSQSPPLTSWEIWAPPGESVWLRARGGWTIVTHARFRDLLAKGTSALDAGPKPAPVQLPLLVINSEGLRELFDTQAPDSERLGLL